MTPERFQLVSRLFEQACQLDAGVADAFLQEHCGEDLELRGQVQELLTHDAAPRLFDKGSSVGAGARMLAMEVVHDAEPSDSETAPNFERVGRCRIVRTIASGGMGTVYEAIQDNPRRTVALKVLRQGIASASAMRRFEYEADVLARLQHPSIAQIHEAGTHEEAGHRVPYFIMEYVPHARTITAYADAVGLTTRDRLHLFTRVCDAVHHGHQRGIIHRDLKPGNILVDDSGVPRVIDFGVARSTDADVALATQHTDVGQLVGTLQYMSPEQCRADPCDLDTRSDVYALGLVLFELLSGQRPYDVVRLPLPEAIRVVCETAPESLSHCAPELSGDIATIVHKAIDKDRDRRYASASELGRDLHRFLEGQAIAARPPSAAYQLRLLMRRHKAVFGAIAAVFVVLVAGIVFSTAMYVRAERARLEVVDAQEEAGDRRAQAEAVTTFLTDMLASSNPLSMPGEAVKVRDVLDRAAADIDTRFPDQPLVEATLRATIGRTYLALALPHEAEPHVRKALEIRLRELDPDDLDVADALLIDGQLEYDLGHYATALAQAEHAVDIRRQHLSHSHPDVADALTQTGVAHWALGQAAEAEALIREGLEIRQAHFEPHHPDVADSLHLLGLALRATGEWRQAEQTYRQALILRREHYGAEHPKVATTLNNLAVLMRVDKKDYAESVALFREALDIRRRALGDQHEHTASTLRNLGSLLGFLHHYDEAEALLREALEIRRTRLGEDHPYVLNVVGFVANVLDNRGDYAAALPLRREALELGTQRYGAEDKRVIGYTHNLAWTLVGLGQLDEAETHYRSALAIGTQSWGVDHSTNFTLMKHLINLYMIQERFDEAHRMAAELLEGYAHVAERPDADAEQINTLAWTLATCDVFALRDAQRALTLAQQANSLSNDEDVEILDTMTVAYQGTGDGPAAIEVGRKALALLPPQVSPRRAEVEERLVGALEDHGELDAAEMLHRSALEQRQAELPVDHGLINDGRLGLGLNLVQQERFAEAESELQAALDSQRRALQPGHWRIAEVECALGAAVAGQGRMTDGALLMESCARVAGQGVAPHRRRVRSMRLWIAFLDGQDRADEASVWRRTLDQRS